MLVGNFSKLLETDGITYNSNFVGITYIMLHLIFGEVLRVYRGFKVNANEVLDTGVSRGWHRKSLGILIAGTEMSQNGLYCNGL